MAPAPGVVAHVRRPAKAGQAAAGHCRRMAIAVYLQGRANEQVHGVLPGQLAHHAVGAQ